jgi:hypothetical protein
VSAGRAARRVSLALVHYPVLDRGGAVITTTVTNLDIHDLARSARTYGLERVYIVTPIAAQRTLVERVRGHWVGGSGGVRIPDRSAALELVCAVDTLEAALAGLAGDGEAAEVWTTAASARGAVTSFSEARARMRSPGPPVMLVYGTGWGLAPPVFQRPHLPLEPIDGGSGWNHLSVRAACAISLDRLLGPG